MKTALGKKSASAIAVAALAIGIGIGVAPAADAATATTKFSRQFIGAYNPSGGPITWSDFIFRPATIGLAKATPVVITDTATPGKTRIDFQTTIECYCVVNWKNQNTGGSGTVAGNLASPFDTGSGRVTATVTIDEGITFLAGSGAWTVP